MRIPRNSREITAFAFAVLLAAGCMKKSDDQELSPQQEEEVAFYSIAAETRLQMIFNDVFDNVMGVSNEVGIAGTGIFGRKLTTPIAQKVDSGCFAVNIVPLNLPSLFPLQITIDFGITGCQGQDGHTRYGKVSTVYTGRLILPGSVATTSFENYRIDSFSIEGQYTISNTGLPSGAPTVTVTVENGKISLPNGNYLAWNSNRTITQIAGTLTPDLAIDDAFRITGNAQGKQKRGNTLFLWQSMISEPLRKQFGCRWITEGKIQAWRQGLSSSSPWAASLDYGNGSCDFHAALTINGITTQIQLPH